MFGSHRPSGSSRAQSRSAKSKIAAALQKAKLPRANSTRQLIESLESRTYFDIVPTVVDASLPTTTLISTLSTKTSVEVELTNTGGAAVHGPVTLTLFASSDQTLDSSDPGITQKKINVSLAAGASKTYKIPLKTIPQINANGNYFVLAQVTGANTDPSDDTASSGATLDLELPVTDLATSVNLLTTNQLYYGQNVRMAVTITNNGNYTITGPISVDTSLSPNADGSGQTGLKENKIFGPIAPGQTRTFNISAPIYSTVAVGQYHGVVAVTPQNAFGTFASNGIGVSTNQVDVSAVSYYSKATNYQAGFEPYAVAIADVNGDGNPDVITANYVDDTVSILLQNSGGTGTFDGGTETIGVGTNPDAVAAGGVGLDGNGAVDVFVANRGSNTVDILTNNGFGGLTNSQTLDVGSDPSAVALADLNGDGYADLVVANQGSNTVSVFLNNQGTFSDTPSATYNVSGGPDAVVVGDVTGDGRPDIITADETGNSISVLSGTGGGAFGTAYTVGVGYHPHALAIGDLNGDGVNDLVVANSGNFTTSNNPGTTVSVMINQGTGVFQSYQQYVGTGPSGVALADINGDNKLDIITSNYESDTVGINLGNGNGSFQYVQSYYTGAHPGAVAAADLTPNFSPFTSAGGISIVTANRGGSNSVSVLQSLLPELDAAHYTGITTLTSGAENPNIIQEITNDGRTPANGPITITEYLTTTNGSTLPNPTPTNLIIAQVSKTVHINPGQTLDVSIPIGTLPILQTYRPGTYPGTYTNSGGETNSIDFYILTEVSGAAAGRTTYYVTLTNIPVTVLATNQANSVDAVVQGFVPNTLVDTLFGAAASVALFNNTGVIAPPLSATQKKPVLHSVYRWKE